MGRDLYWNPVIETLPRERLEKLQLRKFQRIFAWAYERSKFDAERIAKAIKGFNVAEKVSRKRMVIPGHVAVLSGELEGELPDWEIRVGPREAVDLPAFMKQAL